LFRDEQKKIKKRKKAQKSTLSFALDDEGDEQESSANGTGSNSPAPGSGADEDGKPSKKAKLGKNPAVDTSFLPDRDREETERKEREELRQEWLRKQEELKNEDIEVTYSYWDGSGHRKSVLVRGLNNSTSRGFLLLPCPV
jgi:protein FAM50